MKETENLKKKKNLCQHASFVGLKDGGRGEGKKRRKRREERRGELKWKDPTSQVAPITGTFRSQFLQKALAAIPQSLPFSLPRSLCPLLANSSSSFFFFLQTILRSQWGHYW